MAKEFKGEFKTKTVKPTETSDTDSDTDPSKKTGILCDQEILDELRS